ncbi:hypothetical protein [uncultured Oribacterium sp.]|uniref:Uncharacterized protein n=1 Tax=Oribacterium sinus F0268 TaxID=585501 RepID=C2KYK7_9FIRM|nr:hypothetical protein [uncultured Oribacterium sp.]EEJ51152.1 hypothetical protein HMPREF6123_1576 [Oribacterium sinus F0268]
MKKIPEAFLYFLSENAIMQKTFFLLYGKIFKIPQRIIRLRNGTTRKQEERRQNSKKKQKEKSAFLL